MTVNVEKEATENSLTAQDMQFSEKKSSHKSSAVLAKKSNVLSVSCNMCWKRINLALTGILQELLHLLPTALCGPAVMDRRSTHYLWYTFRDRCRNSLSSDGSSLRAAHRQL